jgi:hypothetical protein
MELPIGLVTKFSAPPHTATFSTTAAAAHCIVFTLCTVFTLVPPPPSPHTVCHS